MDKKISFVHRNLYLYWCSRPSKVFIHYFKMASVKTWDYFCISYFSIAMIKHHDWSDLQKERVIEAYCSRMIRIAIERHSDQRSKLRGHILNCEQKTDIILGYLNLPGQCQQRAWLKFILNGDIWKKSGIIAALVSNVETSNEVKFIHLRKKSLMYSIPNHSDLWGLGSLFVCVYVVLIVW